ncbi:RNA-binding ATPase activator esf2 [Blastocladiella emersonii ATCC 22665]|nr:RNA-binding ATPase activator esf2 [Blastocladiella emersonii ATCC 22665]
MARKSKSSNSAVAAAPKSPVAAAKPAAKVADSRFDLSRFGDLAKLAPEQADDDDEEEEQEQEIGSEDDVHDDDDEEDDEEEGSDAEEGPDVDEDDEEAASDDGEEDEDEDDPDAAEEEEEEEEEEEDEEEERASKPSKSAKKKVLQDEDLSDFKAKTDRTGLVYLSRVPPFMSPTVVRKLLSQYATLGRIYLAPEDAKAAYKRKKYKGNSRKNYTEGWIEVLDKKEAKVMAAHLNNQIIGGKTLSRWHDTLWNIKYLPKFKWHHLTEQIAYEKRKKEERLRAEILQAKRENKIYMDNVGKAKMVNAMEAKKRKRQEAADGGASSAPAASASAAAPAGPADMSEIRRRFKQRKIVHDVEEVQRDEDISKIKGVLSKIFG